MIRAHLTRGMLNIFYRRSPSRLAVSSCLRQSFHNQGYDEARRHSGNKSKSPGRVLPQYEELGSPWLSASEGEIRQWYLKGKEECSDYLKKNQISGNHAPAYNDKREGDLKRCRGTELLYSLSGMLLWAFGPTSECPTYSKCWFGILSCGTPKIESLKSIGNDKIKSFAAKFNDKKELPQWGNWSVRSLRVHMRVLGLENVVPEQRTLRIDNDEVIVAQYSLTLPSTKEYPYRLELRQDEFYPSVLYQWSKREIDELGMDNVGNVYLGGNEERCRPWTGRCMTPNYCCGCDEKSFVRNTPVTVAAEDAIMKQCGVKMADRKALPVCPHLTSSLPGRWIQSAASALSPRCETTGDTVFISKTISRNNATGRSGWFEASGDPCFIRDNDPEELKTPSWYFAPYSCRYHFYTGDEMSQCFKSKGIGHIHIHGDSMARDLFGYLTRYLGVSALNEEQLKKLTNQMKQKNIKTNDGDIVVSEGYSWDFDVNTLDQVKKQPLPQVVVTNYRLAHSIVSPPEHRKNFDRTEKAYWRDFIKNGTGAGTGTLPKYFFFQSAKDLHGKRQHSCVWSADNFRRNSDYTRAGLGELGFIELDEYTLTAGRIDTYRSIMDGWHFWGTMRQMESAIFVNMLCNDWLMDKEKQKGKETDKEKNRR